MTRPNDPAPAPAITMETAKDILDQLWAGVFAGAHDSALYDELIRNGWPKHTGADAAEPPETDAEFMASVAPFLPPAATRTPPLVAPDYAAPRTAVNDVTNALAAERLAAWRRGEDVYADYDDDAADAERKRVYVAEVVASHDAMDPSWHPHIFEVLRRDLPWAYAAAVRTAVSENARRLAGPGGGAAVVVRGEDVYAARLDRLDDPERHRLDDDDPEVTP